MKKIIIYILTLFLLFLLTGCIAKVEIESEESIGAIVEDEVNESNDIQITVKDGTLTPTGATFLLTNASTYDAYFGSAFELHKKSSDGWHYLLYQEDNLGWTAIANILKAGSTVEIDQQWDTIYGALSSGKYRFVKKVWFEESPNIPKGDLTGESDQYTLSAEFDIG